MTYRGKDAVVAIAVDDLKALLPAERPKRSLVQFLRSTGLDEVEVRRRPDRGREPALCFDPWHDNPGGFDLS